MEKIAYAYGIKYYKIDNIQEIESKIQNVLNENGAVICEVILDEKQNFEPKLSSRVLPDGSMVSPELDDMYPFIPKEEYEQIKKEVLDL